MAQMNLSNTLWNDDSSGTIAFVEQLKDKLLCKYIATNPNYSTTDKSRIPAELKEEVGVFQEKLNEFFLDHWVDFQRFLLDEGVDPETIDSWKEVQEFLEGLPDDETMWLKNKLAALDTAIAGIDQDGVGIFDVSAYNNIGGTYATYNGLSAALTAIPTASKRSGMTIRYIDSTSNQYEEYRYILQYEGTTAGNAAFNNTANWQGIDAAPTAGSKNLVKSDGVAMDFFNFNNITISGHGVITNWKSLAKVRLKAGNKYLITFTLDSAYSGGTTYCYLRDDTFVEGRDSGNSLIGCSIGANTLSKSVEYVCNQDVTANLVVYKSNGINITGKIVRIIKVNTSDLENDAVTLDKINSNAVDESPTLGSVKLLESGGAWKELATKVAFTSQDVTTTENIMTDRYIKYNDGTVTTAAATGQFTLRYYNLLNVKQIICKLGCDGGIPAAIAFYSQEITGGAISGRYYMKSVSLDALAGINTYESSIPEGAKSVVICNRGANLANPQITFIYNTIPNVTESISEIKSIAQQSKEIGVTGFGMNPFFNKPYFYHYSPNKFVIDGSGRNGIASESIEDIELAARLGFSFIELNIHKTSDNNFVCIHGTSGKLGPEVKSLDENVISTADLQNTLISSVTLDYIKNYARYDSYYQQYQTTIPSLEEACSSCKVNNIGVFAGTNDSAAIEILRKYLGNNVILYNPASNIRETFNGFVFYWANDDTKTIDNLISIADSYGAPFMLGVGPSIITAYKQAGTLGNLIKAFHDKSYLIGFAGIYQTEPVARELFELGMDFSGTGYEVNPFESNYKLYDIADEHNLPTLAGTGNITDGVANLDAGDILTCGNTDVISIGKGSVSLRFNGKLTISFGVKGSYNRTIESNGAKNIIISDHFFKNHTRLIVTAVEPTTIYSFVYKTSKC